MDSINVPNKESIDPHHLWAQFQNLQLSLATLKAMSMLLILCSSIVGTALPLRVSRSVLENKHVCAGANMLSSGAILSAALTHLLAESIEEQPAMTRTLCLVTAVSFLVMVVLNALNHISFVDSTLPDASLPLINTTDLLTHPLLGGSTSASDLPVRADSPHTIPDSSCDNPQSNLGHTRTPEQVGAPRDASADREIERDESCIIQVESCPLCQRSTVLCPDAAQGHRSKTGRRRLVAIWGVVFTIHSLIEGLALGAQRNTTEVVSVFMAIIVHKALAAFVVSLALLSAGWRGWGFAAVAVPFAAATPLGILIGWAVAENCDERAAALCSAVGAGTFLYIAAVELIPEAMADRSQTGLNACLLVGGFVVMTVAGNMAG
mmetsp:Transcript_22831/g.38161  ORF Transcript_22831/g.38161 Transcript_22831/m.38161 type:complete len:378 (+) Transcript_22831:383-1516(+)|eukprot:CAMPEP_0198210816 /NCGR_PEP_ID=MMETSP1445-20131203/22462_1 /TAXON_ID=36898 /ORGANISM="Pyramimonas sp., Strain CCMP2087" /LENGTH=377 /DNA_ID=CAMNT_0043884971 /DNA_START=409 /DNA_END=1542 /DNA_ORIENTATION=+